MTGERIPSTRKGIKKQMTSSSGFGRYILTHGCQSLGVTHADHVGCRVIRQ